MCASTPVVGAHSRAAQPETIQADRLTCAGICVCASKQLPRQRPACLTDSYQLKSVCNRITLNVIQTSPPALSHTLNSAYRSPTTLSAHQPRSHTHTTRTTHTTHVCRNMILTMVGEPLVIAIKLADRLHNMRTV